jgi:hypothetical protein
MIWLDVIADLIGLVILAAILLLIGEVADVISGPGRPKRPTEGDKDG